MASAEMPNNDRAKIPRATQEIASKTTSVMPFEFSSRSALSIVRFFVYQRDTAEFRFCDGVSHEDTFHA